MTIKIELFPIKHPPSNKEKHGDKYVFLRFWQRVAQTIRSLIKGKKAKPDLFASKAVSTLSPKHFTVVVGQHMQEPPTESHLVGKVLMPSNTTISGLLYLAL